MKKWECVTEVKAENLNLYKMQPEQTEQNGQEQDTAKGKKLNEVMQMIKNMRITEKYDMEIEEVFTIEEMSKDKYDLIQHGFKYGFVQGIKAAKEKKAE